MEASNKEYSRNVYSSETSFTEKSQIGRKPSKIIDWLITFVPFVMILLIVQCHLILDSNSDTIIVSYENRHFVEAVFSSTLATVGYHSPTVKHSWLLQVPWLTKAIHYCLKSSFELINMNLEEPAPEYKAVNILLLQLRSFTASHRNESLIIEKDETYERKHLIVGVFLLQNITAIILFLTTCRRLYLTMAMQSIKEKYENASR